MLYPAELPAREGNLTTSVSCATKMFDGDAVVLDGDADDTRDLDTYQPANCAVDDSPNR